MLQNKTLLCTAIVLITLCQVACKKDSTNPKSRSQLLTEQNWKLIVYQYNYNNLGWTDGFAGMYDCRKDDILSFKSNFIYILEEGVLKCDPSGSQIFRQGTWEFQANETKIFTLDTIGRETVEIKQLDETSLKTIRRDTMGSDIFITEANYIH